jgi:hypothetical protein
MIYTNYVALLQCASALTKGVFYKFIIIIIIIIIIYLLAIRKKYSV